jgi:hypothetical protein
MSRSKGFGSGLGVTFTVLRLLGLKAFSVQVGRVAVLKASH